MDRNERVNYQPGAPVCEEESVFESEELFDFDCKEVSVIACKEASVLFRTPE